MAAEDEGRTEQATGKRIQEAREKGNVAVSRDLLTIIPAWVIYAFFSFAGVGLIYKLADYFQYSIRRSFNTPLAVENVTSIFMHDALLIIELLGPAFVTAIVLAFVLNLLQTDFYFHYKGINFDTISLNPVALFQRLLGKNALFELFKGFCKMAVLGGILYFLLSKEIFTLPLLIDMDIKSILMIALSHAGTITLVSLIVLSIFAVMDFAWQRYQYQENLKMTKQDVQDEQKQLEGDPRVKARIRSLQRQMAMKRMMQAVPKADVVITNPTHLAIALKYDAKKMSAPTVVAKGANLIAERIKAIAQTHNVPVFEDKPLAQALFKLEIGQEIPELLYKAVASILANVYKLKRQKPLAA